MDPLETGFRPNQESPEERELKDFMLAADSKRRGFNIHAGYMDPLESGFRPNQESPEERGLNDLKDEQKRGRNRKT